ncbi:MAG: tetratricopeptide repeat protein, partial [Candidatus Omnitrophica bacterium]|nr:tetratricopeptide repeat protein [Candidatus Omnitrophota bacterium]
AVFLKTPIAFLTGSVTPNLTHSLLAALPFWICAVACKLILRTSQDKSFASMGRIGGTAGMAVGLLAASLYLYFDVWQVVLINKNFAHGWTLGLYAIALTVALPLNYAVGWAAGDLLDEGRNTRWKAVLAPVRFTLILGCFILLTLGLREVRATKHLLDIYFKGKSLAMAGKGSEALAELNKAAGLKARIGESFIGKAHLMIGYTSMHNYQFKQAEAAYLQALQFKMDPANTAIIHVSLGNLYKERLYNIEAAEQHYRMAIAANPDVREINLKMYSNLAEILLATNKIDEAGRIIQQGLAIKPAAELHLLMAAFHAYKGDADKALEIIDRDVVPGVDDSQLLMVRLMLWTKYTANEANKDLRSRVDVMDLARILLFDLNNGPEAWHRKHALSAYLSYKTGRNREMKTTDMVYFPCPNGAHCHTLLPASCRSYWLSRPNVIFDRCDGAYCETVLRALQYGLEWDAQLDVGY